MSIYEVILLCAALWFWLCFMGLALIHGSGGWGQKILGGFVLPLLVLIEVVILVVAKVLDLAKKIRKDLRNRIC